MEKLQKGLDFLLEKYADGKKATLVSRAAVEEDGIEIPLLPWRCQRRFTELRDLVRQGRLEDVSVIRTSHIARRGTPVAAILRRELDICSFLLDSPARVDYAAWGGETVCNMVATLANGVVCTIEAAATLPESAAPIDKHEIIARRGVACDRAVDTQVPQSSVYVFAEGCKEAYTDTDFELYGLSEEDAAVVRQAFLAVTDAEYKETLCRAAEALGRADI